MDQLRRVADDALADGRWADALHASKWAVGCAYGSSDPLEAADQARIVAVSAQLTAHARLQRAVGELAEAADGAELAAGLFEAIYRPTPPELDAFRAEVLLELGELERARVLALRAAARLSGADQAVAMTTHARILRRLGRREHSVKIARDALCAFEDAWAADHPAYVEAGLILCANLLETGDKGEVKLRAVQIRRACPQTIRPREHALAMYLSAAAATHDSIDRLVMIELADSLLSVCRMPGDPELDEARSLAVRIRARAAVQAPEGHVRAYAQAALLHESGEHQEAVSLFRRLPGSTHALATALVGCGRRADLQEAVELLESLPRLPLRVAEIGRAMLALIRLAQQRGDGLEAIRLSMDLMQRCLATPDPAVRMVHAELLELTTSPQPDNDRTYLLRQTVDLRRGLLNRGRPQSRRELAVALERLGLGLLRSDATLIEAAQALLEAYGTLGGLDPEQSARLREHLLMINDTHPEIADALDFTRRL
ncbi:MAG: hypothetical protein HOV86_23960 [Thermoactinospora sp.]|nr:hypothetical protein [Thermoactinospora sp.]